MAYDGSIKIDSRIDPRGFNAGVKGMMTALKPLAVMLATVFAARAIFDFGRSAVQAASDMASSFIGLQSIVEGTGNSFAKAKEFINDYISDGLVPVMNATTAYKNLLLRGYDTSQIERVLTALKNSAAFGRQASLTLGFAVQSATEGLKNENSILVDNAGVTKNVSLMWRDYAASIGTTVGVLTKEQKIEAEVQGILEETRFQMGDSAKLAGTYAGQMSALGVSFLNLKVAIGNAIIPIISAILPYIKAAIDALTIFFNRVALIMSILFGVNISATATAGAMEDIASGANAAADAQGNLAEQTKKAGKAAKGALAPFDELNVLASETDTGTGGAGAAPVVGGGISLPAPDTTALDDGLDELKAKVEAWKQSFLDFVQPVIDALGRLWKDAQPLITTLGNIFLWIWNNVLAPLAAWIVQTLVPALLDIAGPILLIVNDILTALGPAWGWFWKEILKPAAAWIGAVLIDVLVWLGESLRGVHEWFGKLDPTVQGLIGGLVVLFAILAAGLLPLALIVVAIGAIISVILHWGDIVQWFKDLWAREIANIKLKFDLFMYGVRLLWDGIWTYIKTKWDNFWLGIRIGIESAKKLFSDFWTNLRTGWDKLTAGLKTAWEKTWTGIKDFVRNPINAIIDFINGLIRAVTSGLNAVIRGLNKIQIKMPDWLGGKSFGFHLSEVSAPQIPRLATGAVIPPAAPFAAILGDQRSGRNIETPEALMRQIMREEVGRVEANIRIEFGGSLAQLVRQLKPFIDQENVRIGGSLIKSGVTAR